MQINNDIFENLTPATATTTHVDSVSTSSIIERPSKTTKANVQYVRLSDDEHATLLAYVEALNMMRTDKTISRSILSST